MMASLRTELCFQLTTYEPRLSFTYQPNRMKNAMRPLIPLVTTELHLTHPLQATSHLGPGSQVPPEQPAAVAPPPGRAPAPGPAQENKTHDAQTHSAHAVWSNIQLRPHRPTARMLLSLKVQRHPSFTTWTKQIRRSPYVTSKPPLFIL